MKTLVNLGVWSNLLVGLGLAALGFACANDKAPSAPSTAPDGGIGTDGRVLEPRCGDDCPDACAEAAASNSYIGCEYWPTAALNSDVPNEFEFAVVVANPQGQDAAIEITQAGRVIRSVTVGPRTLQTIRLPWVTALKGVPASARSVLARGGAYRLVSSLPVTVYQFNALDFRIERDCSNEPAFELPDGQCFSFTNDASLLLPTHVLTGNYMVMARASLANEIAAPTGLQLGTHPGYFAVTAVDENPVTVSITFQGHVASSSSGDITPYRAGDTGTFTLNQGDVLQIVGEVPTVCGPGGRTESVDGTQVTYCDVGPEYDLTGSVIQASGPVAVLSGHNCAFVPFDRWACDHLEEAMFPLEAWGKDYVVTTSQPLRGEPNVVRLLSGRDNNQITFIPPDVHNAVTLGRGEMLEFETSQDFRVTGSEAFMAAQFLVGQDYNGINTAGVQGAGDPALSLGIPIEQYRTSYTFLAPETYQQSWVNVIASAGQQVTLDATAVSGFTPVGNSGLQTARVMIAGGQHQIASTDPFGIVVYGFGAYTSYMYPGGLDLEVINEVF